MDVYATAFLIVLFLVLMTAIVYHLWRTHARKYTRITGGGALKDGVFAVGACTTGGKGTFLYESSNMHVRAEVDKLIFEKNGKVTLHAKDPTMGDMDICFVLPDHMEIKCSHPLTTRLSVNSHIRVS